MTISLLIFQYFNTNPFMLGELPLFGPKIKKGKNTRLNKKWKRRGKEIILIFQGYEKQIVFFS